MVPAELPVYFDSGPEELRPYVDAPLCAMRLATLFNLLGDTTG